MASQVKLISPAWILVTPAAPAMALMGSKLASRLVEKSVRWRSGIYLY